MNKSSSRIPPPSVAPLIDGKMRYEQIPNGLLAGLGQMGGLLAVIDRESGERRVIRVYENQREHGKEGDVQDAFFTSMKLQSDGRLLIENENGDVFVVDPDKGTSLPAVSDSGSEAS